MSKFTLAAITVAALAAPTVTFADETWTGFHLGAHIATSSLSVDLLGDLDDTTAYGIQAGYDHDFGQFVLGAEIDYSTAEYTIALVSGVALIGDINTLRLKLRGGYDLGRTLVYGIIGIVNIDDGDGYTGSTVGLGLSYKATDNIIVSGEYLRDSFDVFGVDFDIDSFAIRAAYKF